MRNMMFKKCRKFMLKASGILLFVLYVILFIFHGKKESNRLCAYLVNVKTIYYMSS